MPKNTDMYSKIKLFILSVIVATGLLFAVKSTAAEIVLNSNNTVILDGPVNYKSVAKVGQRLLELDRNNESSDPIYLVLDTPGGSISDGLALIEMIKSVNRPVHTITLFAASMGFQIVQQVKGKRYITEFGELMSHKASGRFSGEFPGQLDNRYAHTLRILSDMDKKVIERTSGKHTKDSYEKLYENEYWAHGSLALKDGFADEIASVRCDSTLNGTRIEEFDVFIFTFLLEKSNCPVVPGVINVQVKGDYYQQNEFKKELQQELNIITKKDKTILKSW